MDFFIDISWSSSWTLNPYKKSNIHTIQVKKKKKTTILLLLVAWNATSANQLKMLMQLEFNNDCMKNLGGLNEYSTLGFNRVCKTGLKISIGLKYIPVFQIRHLLGK